MITKSLEQKLSGCKYAGKYFSSLDFARLLYQRT